MIYDLIIIGAGPAGLSAAIYAVRKKLNTLVLSADIGGQTTEAHLVNNYLGVPEILGVELVEKFKDHAKKLAIEIKESVNVKSISKSPQNVFEIITNKGVFETRAIIAATGKTYRRLDIPGAKEFEGKGITYCATCDAPLFKNKTVAVVGGGDAGQDAVWQLTEYAAKIYLLNRYPNLRGDDIRMQEQLKSHKKIEIINECYPVEVKGDKFVKNLIYQCNGSDEKKEIEIDGVFIEIGSSAASEYLKDVVDPHTFENKKSNNLSAKQKNTNRASNATCNNKGVGVELNERGEIIIDPKTNMTSCTGIFAAGDVTNITQKQMIVAAGEGAKAALSAYEYLKSQNT